MDIIKTKFLKSKILEKITVAYEQKRLAHAIYSRTAPFICGIKYLLYNPAGKRIKLHRPAYITPDKDDTLLAQRIFASYKKMKADQASAGELYQPSSLWEAELKRSYAYLISGLEENNLEKFHFFLANFGAWKEYTGIEESSLIQKYAKPGSLITRRYLQNEVFNNLLKLWEYYSLEKKTTSLQRPTHGNLSGAYIDGILVTVDSFFGQIYGSLLSGLLEQSKRPVIAELGGGGGRLAYYILRNRENFCYIDFDLPEVLCVGAYYLMKAFGQKKILLYGEDQYSPASHQKYDLIFMPSHEMRKLNFLCIDLFLNETSLGEMAPEAASNYLNYITKSTRLFFHMNHDRVPNIYSDLKRGLLGHDYPIPRDKFKLLFRYPDLKHLLYNAVRADLHSDIFIYLYQRIKD